MTLPSRHRIRNSNSGGLRPSTLPLGHWGFQQYKHFCFFQTAETGKRTPNSSVKGSGTNHYPSSPPPKKNIEGPSVFDLIIVIILKCWTNADLILAYRLRRWPNIEPALGQCILFDVIFHILLFTVHEHEGYVRNILYNLSLFDVIFHILLFTVHEHEGYVRNILYNLSLFDVIFHILLFTVHEHDGYVRNILYNLSLSDVIFHISLFMVHEHEGYVRNIIYNLSLTYARSSRPHAICGLRDSAVQKICGEIYIKVKKKARNSIDS